MDFDKRQMHLLTERRYDELERTGGPLTLEEIDSGWHFCPDWDGLLVGPGMPESRHCLCDFEVKNG